ncbi:MAG: citramalate synthase, partial [Thaumarchaeota archaeon]|nr:citramalate synthase [Nitrososphaerota archaeon]
LSITQRLDELGVRYIEGGWPGSNPKDVEYFKAVKHLTLTNSEVVAFGSTRRKDISSDKDQTLSMLVDAGVKTAVIFGKSWDLHVTDILRTTLEENMNMVTESIEYLKSHGLKVIYDAEHFFDGFKNNPEYALSVVSAAAEAGAQTIVLCDTNGGTLTHEVTDIAQQVRKKISIPLGIHCHNDAGLAVANTIASVLAGISHVQGTINGLGERCGNADLCQVLPILQFKMHYNTLSSKQSSEESLKGLTTISRYVYQLLNMNPVPQQPFVGKNAFAHKAGVHVDAVIKHLKAYEHMEPTLLGNNRSLVVSELAGKAGIIREASEIGLDLEKNAGAAEKVLQKIKELESKGYQFENAKASIHLLLLKEMKLIKEPFIVKYWRSTIVREDKPEASAEVVVTVGDSDYHETAEGVGPVHALDQALRKALRRRFPELNKVNLINYKVTVVDSVSGTASYVRVFIEFEDDGKHWATTSVSENILEASAAALVEGYTYKLTLIRRAQI